jgi:CRP-like cAMP-binding protein
MILLGSATALEKVSAFLLEMAERSTVDSVNAIILPMSRYDIADYLAIAVETVSRALTELRRKGAIALGDPRRVRIVDRSALRSGLDDGVHDHAPAARPARPQCPARDHA